MLTLDLFLSPLFYAQGFHEGFEDVEALIAQAGGPDRI